MGLLSGKVVLITGAGRGIGQAAALACAQAGACVVLNDLGCDLEGGQADPSVVRAAAAAITAGGGEVLESALDITNPAAAHELVQATLARFGRIDGLFAAAGISRERLLPRLLDDDLERVLAVHLHAPIRLTRAVVRTLQERNQPGAIVLSSAQAAFVGSRGQTAYAAAAAGITGFTRAAALELRRHGIRVNALCALARTRSTEHLPIFEASREGSLTPEHAAQVALYLLSPLAAEVSGEIVGAAGSRVYTLRLHETSGAFLDGQPFDAEDLSAAWPRVTRG
ncbi:MAG TPA: SDR family NAD(P)-dependent oxidoreductase [Polyangiales bacterium]